MKLIYLFTLLGLFTTGAAARGEEVLPVPEGAALRDVASLRAAQVREKLGVLKEGLRSSDPAIRNAALQEWDGFRRQDAERVTAMPRPTRATIPYVEQVDIPENASVAMEELLVRQAYARNQQIWLANILRGGTAQEKQTAVQNWAAQRTVTTRALEAQARVVEEEAVRKPIPVPVLPSLPAEMSLRERNAVLQRHAEITARIEAENLKRAQRASANPTTPGSGHGGSQETPGNHSRP